MYAKHDVAEDNADDTSNILISGKKPVVDGEYAIVEIKPTLDNEALLEQLRKKKRRISLANKIFAIKRIT